MANGKGRAILLAVGSAGAAMLAGYFLGVRQWQLRRGATDAEVNAVLPGDELVPGARWGWTQAVTINAPPSRVWPWLAQVGYGRGGWYTFDPLYEWMGAADFVDGHSAQRIIPELQDVKVGDHIRIMKDGPFKVAMVEREKMLVLHEASYDTQAPKPEQYINVSWGYYLRDLGNGQTRLLTRFRMDAKPTAANVAAFGIFIDLGSLLMQPKMLQGIKARAER